MNSPHDVFDFTTEQFSEKLTVKAAAQTRTKFNTRGCEALCGFIVIGEHKLPFTDFCGSPLHATDSVEALAALILLVSHDTEAEEVGGMISHDLTDKSSDYRIAPIDLEQDMWARYYDSGDDMCLLRGRWSLIWGDRIVHDGLRSFAECEEMARHVG